MKLSTKIHLLEINIHIVYQYEVTGGFNEQYCITGLEDPIQIVELIKSIISINKQYVTHIERTIVCFINNYDIYEVIRDKFSNDASVQIILEM